MNVCVDVGILHWQLFVKQRVVWMNYNDRSWSHDATWLQRWVISIYPSIHLSIYLPIYPKMCLFQLWLNGICFFHLYKKWCISRTRPDYNPIPCHTMVSPVWGNTIGNYHHLFWSGIWNDSGNRCFYDVQFSSQQKYLCLSQWSITLFFHWQTIGCHFSCKNLQ